VIILRALFSSDVANSVAARVGCDLLAVDLLSDWSSAGNMLGLQSLATGRTPIEHLESSIGQVVQSQLVIQNGIIASY